MKRVLILAVLMTLMVLQVAVAQDKTLEEKLELFSEYAVEVQEKWGIPGMAFAVVKGNEVLLQECSGYLSTEREKEVNEETNFQIGSTSKAFTTTLIAMLEAENRLDWHDKVRAHHPTFEMYDAWVSKNMEIRDLTSQHSGLAAYAADYLSIAGYSKDYMIDKLAEIEPVYAFRSDFTYVNNLFLVAEKVLENLTGLKQEKLLKERIFKPLEMMNTTVSYEDFINSDNHVVTYKYELENQNNKNEITFKAYDEDDDTFRWSYTYLPAGGINSNINDMINWLTFHINAGHFKGETIVSEQSLKYVYQPATFIHSEKPGDLIAYCQGWVYEDREDLVTIWHNGSTFGSKTMIAFLPEYNVGIVILSNVGDTNMPDNLARDFFDLYLDREFQKRAMNEVESLLDQKPDLSGETKSHEEQTLADKAYTGRYENRVYGIVEINSIDGELIMTMGPGNLKITLHHLFRDTFRMDLDQLYMDDFGQATFSIGKNAQATGFSIDYVEAEGCGTFERVVE